MERVSTVGEVATAKTLARMLSATPPAANGIPTFCILDIHALQEVSEVTTIIVMSMTHAAR